MEWKPNLDDAITLEQTWFKELAPQFDLDGAALDAMHKVFIAGAMAALRALANGVEWSVLRQEISAHSAKPSA